MDAPNANSTPEQLAAIEKKWAEAYYGEAQNPELQIHDSPWLERCINKVTGDKTNMRWFVPLCEKSPAMKCLVDHGHYVIGVELVGKAIEEFFDMFGIKFTKSDLPELKFGCLYQSEDKRIKIFKCNIFHVTRDLIGGPVDAVWDRGSLQAIAEGDRQRYSEVILSLLDPSGKILAETFEMKADDAQAADSNETASSSTGSTPDCAGSGAADPGPQEEDYHSQSVTETTVETLYGERCTIEVLAVEHWGDDCQAVADDQPYSSINTVRLITLK